MSSDSFLDRGMAAIRAGDRGSARRFLCQALREDPDSESAYLWLSAALGTSQAKAFCLRRVLEINPNNEAARSQLSRLAQWAASHPDQLPDGPAAQPAVAPAPTSPPEAVTTPAAQFVAEHRPSDALRVARYVGGRSLTLLLALAVGLFLATVLINYGGFIDAIFEDRIEWALLGMASGMQGQPPDEIRVTVDEAREAMREAYGLNEPFLLRCSRWFVRGLTLRLGEAERFQTAGSRDRSVRAIILDRLPNSLLLLGAGNLFLFVFTLFLALVLSRRHGSLVDRLIIGLSPVSAAPTWVHGLLLTVVFAAELHLLPFGGMFDPAPPDHPLGYVWVVGKHMVLPVAAIFFATFFQSVYSWRTYFLLHSREDYVEMAEAKGLPTRMLERRYILRPTLPYILTNFALVLITSWQGLLILEVFFHWPGLGQLFIEGIQRNDRPVLVGLIAIFAYLLALTVFLLDIAYAVVDPRVKIGSRATRARAVGQRRGTGVRRLMVWRPKWDALRGWPRRFWQSLTAVPAGLGSGLRQLAGGLGTTLRALVRYPSALLGLMLILALIVVSIHTLMTSTVDEAIDAWRETEGDWYMRPRNAQPTWVNLFRRKDLPPTIMMNSSEGAATKSVEAVSEQMTQIQFLFPLDYNYGALPQDLLVLLEADFSKKHPHLILTWITPDGREIEFASFAQTTSNLVYYLSSDERFGRGLPGIEPLAALFVAPDSEEGSVLQGRYSLRVDGFVFEEDADLEARFVLVGQVYGLAGTDDLRRDLMIPLRWGAPVALAFGLLGAVATSLASLAVAGAGAWFGGWADELVQRLTEVNMILPALPIAIMVYLAYSKSIWVILAVMVLLSIFGSAVKNYRAAFLQVKEAAYVEAARAYGASDRRIILRYLVPRVMPLLVPNLVALIPGYVFLEATLSLLGVSDPVLPTWGKLVVNSLDKSLYNGHYHLVLIPLAALMLTGFSFALLGMALEHILDPRLRRQ
jgi:peptide/nickel transport system permease protein